MRRISVWICVSSFLASERTKFPPRRCYYKRPSSVCTVPLVSQTIFIGHQFVETTHGNTNSPLIKKTRASDEISPTTVAHVPTTRPTSRPLLKTTSISPRLPLPPPSISHNQHQQRPTGKEIQNPGPTAHHTHRSCLSTNELQTIRSTQFKCKCKLQVPVLHVQEQELHHQPCPFIPLTRRDLDETLTL